MLRAPDSSFFTQISTSICLQFTEPASVHRVLSSFYYGNITHPSKDLPRIGFSSVVPKNAAELLKVEVSAHSLLSQSGEIQPTVTATTSLQGENTLATGGVNGEVETPKPVPENLFGQRLQNGAVKSAQIPTWFGFVPGLKHILIFLGIERMLPGIWTALLAGVWSVVSFVVAIG